MTFGRSCRCHVVPGANIGDRMAVFEAVHGTPDIEGKGMATLAVLDLHC